MIRSNGARALALAATLLLPAACGGGDSPGPGPSTTAVSTPLQTTAPAVAATTATSPGSTTSAVPPPDASVRLIEVTFAGGQVSGGAQRSTAQIGEKVRLRVRSDVADEIHVHTYDLRAAVTPAQPAVLDFVASIPGRHEVELEGKRKQLLVLEVR
jgi:hypothetical protein